MKDQHTQVIACPSCGKDIITAHPGINLVICSCGEAAYLAGGMKPEKIATFQVFSARDLIQPGTTGKWKGRSFEVLGRFRAWFQESVWNYWTILFEDGQLAYLGEGYGNYAMYIPEEGFLGWAGQDHRGAKMEKRIQLTSDKNCILERMNLVTRWEVEGQVWMPRAEFSWASYDLTHESGYHAEVFEFQRRSYQAFMLQFASFEELGLSGLRSINLPPKTFSCQVCDGITEIIGFPEVQSFTCSTCNRAYGIQAGIDLKKEDAGKLEDGPGIPLGSKGMLRGVEYEVIGFAVKQENSTYASRWREYTLYHPAQGFAFLSEYDGHWIFLRDEHNAPLVTSPVGSFDYDGEDFQLYNTYTYKLVGAKGMFPGNIFNDEGKKVWEYISPPEIWTKENNQREGVSWFHGVHLDGKELVKAFGENIILPGKEGIGAVQPTGYINIADLIKGAFAAILLLLAVHLGTSVSSEQVLFKDSVSFYDSSNNVTKVYGPFELTKWKGSMQLDISANVENSWVEVNASLVNTKTGEELNVEKGVEYYYGYEDGERWSEGGRSREAYFSRIPRGNYTLEITGIRPVTVGMSERVASFFNITAVYDTPYHSNFFAFVGFVALVAFLWYLITQWMEKKRWSNSPYSPYEEDE